MLCPKCKVDLKFKQRNNTVINYCTRCHGVWLDEELDELRRKRAAARQSHGHSEDKAAYSTAYGFRKPNRRPRDQYAAKSSLISRYWQTSYSDKASAF